MKMTPNIERNLEELDPISPVLATLLVCVMGDWWTIGMGITLSATVCLVALIIAPPE